MPLTSWLRALLPSARPAAPKATDHSPPAPTPAAETTDLSTIDNGVRMHIAAHDPAFPDKREAAVKAIIHAIDAVAQAHGFTKKPQSWAKTGDLGTVTIHLQRSRYGFDCHINLGFQPLSEAAFGPWAHDDFVPLARFLPPNTQVAEAVGPEEPGTLTYLDVLQDAHSLDMPMQVLSDQALPWLLAHLTNPDAHSLPFLAAPTAVQ